MSYITKNNSVALVIYVDLKHLVRKKRDMKSKGLHSSRLLEPRVDGVHVTLNVDKKAVMREEKVFVGDTAAVEARESRLTRARAAMQSIIEEDTLVVPGEGSIVGSLAGYKSRTRIPFLYPLFSHKSGNELATNVNQLRSIRPVSWCPPKYAPPPPPPRVGHGSMSEELAEPVLLPEGSYSATPTPPSTPPGTTAHNPFLDELEVDP